MTPLALRVVGAARSGPIRRSAPVVAALLAGCVHAPDPSQLSRFAEATGKVHAQADLAFGRANAVSRQAAIDLFVASRRPGLSERSFPPAIDAASIAAWDSALSDLERYGALLARLTDGGRGGRTTAAVAALGRELQSGETRTPIGPGVGAGFAALAGILVDASGATSAKRIMAETDPDVRRVLTAMAEAVGADPSEGLQGTVATNWTATTAPTRIAYAAAAEKGDETRQRALAVDYLASIDRRDSDLKALAALRSSLLALADAHSAAAAGSAPTQAAIIDGIDRRLADARRDIRTLGGGE